MRGAKAITPWAGEDAPGRERAARATGCCGSFFFLFCAEERRSFSRCTSAPLAMTLPVRAMMTMVLATTLMVVSERRAYGCWDHFFPLSARRNCRGDLLAVDSPHPEREWNHPVPNLSRIALTAADSESGG